MKKLLSIMLSAVMVMAMFSGLVLFESTAATELVTMSLSGVQGWTQAELDTSSGNNGYANGCTCKMTIENKADYIVGDADQAIKCVWGGSGSYNSCLVNWKYSVGGPCTAKSCWDPADETAKAADYDGIRIAVLNAEGELTNYSSVTLRVTDGRNYSSNMWYASITPERDAEGYLYFPFSKFVKNGTPGVATSVTDYLDQKAFGISMLCYGAEAENTTYFSDFQYYKGTIPAISEDEEPGETGEPVAVHIPFINQYTDAQAKQMKPSNSAPAGGLSFEKSGDYVNIHGTAWDNGWGSKVLAFFTAAGNDQWKMNSLIDGINVFGAADLSNKLAMAFKFGGTDASKVSSVSLCFGSSTKKVAIDLKDFEKNKDGYFYRDYSNIAVVGAGWYQDCPTIQDTFYKVIDECGMTISFNVAAGTELDLYIEDIIVYGSADTAALGAAIQQGDAIGLNVSDAKALYLDNTNFDQDKVDDATNAILAQIEDMTSGIANAKDVLNDLLDAADGLGFFDEESPYYDAVSAADLAFTDSKSTLETLRYHISIVKPIVAKELIESADLIAAVEKCATVWEYNYTSASYKEFIAAADEAWEAIDDEAQALTLFNDAYAKLVPVVATGITADFFSGWDTTDVNNLVTENSEKICDSIGDGLNVQDVWNNGDFSDNTAFEAEDNFSMTALADFTGKSMGWKNMDRSGTLASKKNAGYPTIDVTGLTACDGIRVKIDVDGSADRVLIGLSNCADYSKEMYALRINPKFVAEDGYINIPFSTFEAAWWTNGFKSSELEQVIVLIFEVYGATEGTTVTFSDMKGYKLRSASSSVEQKLLDAALKELEDWDIDSRFEALANKGEALTSENYADEFTAVVDEINTVVKSLKKRGDFRDLLIATAGMQLPSYSDAMDTYYDADATAKEYRDAVALLIKEATPKAPAAPTLKTKTATSVELNLGPDTIEYKCGDGEWGGAVLFEDLTPSTEYKFYARVAAVGAIPASEASEALTVTTDMLAFDADVSISGNFVYGETLTADADVYVGGTDLSYVWYSGSAEVGTDSTYVIGKNDIGKVIKVVVSCDGYSGSEEAVGSEVAKATPVVTTAPSPVTLVIGQPLSSAALVGGEASVDGTFAWVAPTTVPQQAQSGSAFAVVFTPDDTDCYETVNTTVVVTISLDTEYKAFFGEGFSIEGEFVPGIEDPVLITDIGAGDSAYIALLRSAKYCNYAGDGILVLFKNIELVEDSYVGDLLFTANIGADRAGKSYMIFYFNDGGIQNVETTVESDGSINFVY